MALTKQAAEYKAKAVAELVAGWKGKGVALGCFAAFKTETRFTADALAANAWSKGLAISASRFNSVGGTAYIFQRDAYAQLVKEQVELDKAKGIVDQHFAKYPDRMSDESIYP